VACEAAQAVVAEVATRKETKREKKAAHQVRVEAAWVVVPQQVDYLLSKPGPVETSALKLARPPAVA